LICCDCKLFHVVPYLTRAHCSSVLKPRLPPLPSAIQNPWDDGRSKQQVRCTWGRLDQTYRTRSTGCLPHPAPRFSKSCCCSRRIQTCTFRYVNQSPELPTAGFRLLWARKPACSERSAGNCCRTQCRVPRRDGRQFSRSMCTALGSDGSDRARRPLEARLVTPLDGADDCN